MKVNRAAVRVFTQFQVTGSQNGSTATACRKAAKQSIMHGHRETVSDKRSLVAKTLK